MRTTLRSQEPAERAPSKPEAVVRTQPLRVTPDSTLAQVPKTEEESIHRTWLQSFDRQRLLRHVDKLEARVAAQRKEIGRLHSTFDNLYMVPDNCVALVENLDLENLQPAELKQYTPPAIQSVNALKWTIIGVAVLAAVDFYFKYLQVYFQK